jgi:photosystem II stability/assembly factor-like uncharacterized protein
VLVGAGGLTYLTRDGGLTWSAAPAAPVDLRGVSITGDGVRMVAVGAGGLVWRSTDAGSTFAKVLTPGADLHAIGFMEHLPAYGWAVGAAATILHTSDGGAHFEALAAPLAVDYNAIEDFN